MTEQLAGVEARDRAATELCEQIAPADYRVLIARTPTSLEDSGAHVTSTGPQFQEPFDEEETPDWFDLECAPEGPERAQRFRPVDRDRPRRCR